MNKPRYNSGGVGGIWVFANLSCDGNISLIYANKSTFNSLCVALNNPFTELAPKLWCSTPHIEARNSWGTPGTSDSATGLARVDATDSPRRQKVTEGSRSIWESMRMGRNGCVSTAVSNSKSRSIHWVRMFGSFIILEAAIATAETYGNLSKSFEAQILLHKNLCCFNFWFLWKCCWFLLQKHCETSLTNLKQMFFLSKRWSLREWNSLATARADHMPSSPKTK